MQIELDYITEKLHAIDLTLEDVVYRGNTPSGYLTEITLIISFMMLYVTM